jgi:hypothetical protein
MITLKVKSKSRALFAGGTVNMARNTITLEKIKRTNPMTDKLLTLKAVAKRLNTTISEVLLIFELGLVKGNTSQKARKIPKGIVDQYLSNPDDRERWMSSQKKEEIKILESLKLNDYVSVKEAIDLTCLSYTTIHVYLTKGLITGARKFAETRWVIPRQWCKDYAEGKIEIKGAFKGIHHARKRNRAEGIRLADQAVKESVQQELPGIILSFDDESVEVKLASRTIVTFPRSMFRERPDLLSKGQLVKYQIMKRENNSRYQRFIEDVESDVTDKNRDLFKLWNNIDSE